MASSGDGQRTSFSMTMIRLSCCSLSMWLSRVVCTAACAGEPDSATRLCSMLNKISQARSQFSRGVQRQECGFTAAEEAWASTLPEPRKPVSTCKTSWHLSDSAQHCFSKTQSWLVVLHSRSQAAGSPLLLRTLQSRGLGSVQLQRSASTEPMHASIAEAVCRSC